MTVNTANSSAAFTGNGVTVLFPFTFRFFANTDLVVTSITAMGVATTLVLGADYTVQGAGNDAGGSVTTTVPPANGVTLNVSRVLMATQLVSIRNQGKFFAGLHEDVFDYLTMLIQQSLNNTGNALLFPLSDTPGLIKTLPVQIARANKVLAFDANGQPIASNLSLSDLEGQVALSQSYATAAGISATAAAASAAAALASQIAAAASAAAALISEQNAAAALATAQRQLQSITGTVAANALTLGWVATPTLFRSPVLTNGVPNARSPGANLSLVVPSGASLGTVNATAGRVVLLLIDNAGTVELAAANANGGIDFDENKLISTTAISAGATSPSVIYSANARANVPFRIAGYIDITEATAGTWATAPTVIQPAGGTAMNPIAGANRRFTSAIQSISLGAQVLLNHLLGAIPGYYAVYAICNTAQNGFVAGDVFLIQECYDASNTSGYGIQVLPTSTQLKLRIGNTGFCAGLNPSTGAGGTVLSVGNFSIFAIARP